ncbi:hypothetical protein V8E53_013642 [Lactarius tabidus]
MEEPNNGIDTETLQAQIDLAMAQAQNLIASWLPGSSGSLTQSSSRTAEAEAKLQALLRRPPRLGAVAVPGSGATPPTPPRPTLPGLPFQRSLTGVISTENAGLPAPHILNLAGPPSMALEGTEKHPRKKRRRKRKTKKPQFLCTLNTYENGYELHS